MVRYTYAIRGRPTESDKEIRLIEEDVNIMQGEQLTEHYLCNINAAGEVPVIATIDGTTIVRDSLEITKYLSAFYPALIPSSHCNEILDMLKRLHSINFFALTYSGKPETQQKAKALLEQKLHSDINPKYRNAIEYKIKRINSRKLEPLQEENAKANERDALQLMDLFDKNIKSHSTGHCFGFEQPTALDAHLIVFIARMLDVGRDHLILPGLRRYASRLMQGNDWRFVMQSRSTLAPE